MKYSLILLSVLVNFFAWNQCPAGQAEVSFNIHTDAYGYEGYWQLVPSGNACGIATIAEGGNVSVGCLGAGAQAQAPGGYANNIVVNEGPWCLTIGAQYDLIYVDDWGDGGFSFDVLVNGYQITSFDGVGLGATFTFTVTEAPSYDLSVFNSNLYSYVTTGSYDIEAHVFNGGTSTITSYDLNYSVSGGPVFTHNISSTSLTNYTSEVITHSIPLNITTNGVYTISIWASNLNGGNVDEDPSNDTYTKIIEAGPGVPNYLDGYIGQSVSIVQIAGAAEQINNPTDLDFHPVLTNKELWITNKGTEASGGSTVTLFNAGELSQTNVYKQDGNAWHFMSLPTGIAFSQNGNWANSPGVYDANHNGGTAFTGPALWSSDMAIYAQPSGGNGSHLDMLHVSPYCQGIASEKDNVFWVFDGYTSDIVRYDFAEDHGPGNADHADGIIRRYSDDILTKDPLDITVSHMELDDVNQWLYVVDNGNQRVIKIDINTGSNLGGAPNYPGNEPVSEYSEITGYTQETVTSGLQNPAGIDIIENRMLVSEYLTGEIVLYDISVTPAVELQRIPTGLNSVQGIKIGPDGRIWFVDKNTNGVYKIETANLGLVENNVVFSVYPNPSNGIINVNTLDVIGEMIEVRDIKGRLLKSKMIKSNHEIINLTSEAGIYFISISNNDVMSATKKIFIH